MYYRYDTFKWNDKDEYYLKDIRQKRDFLLAISDKYCLVDWPQTPEKKEIRLQYRQSLRDLPDLYLDKMVIIIL